MITKEEAIAHALTGVSPFSDLSDVLSDDEYRELLRAQPTYSAKIEKNRLRMARRQDSAIARLGQAFWRIFYRPTKRR